MSSDGVNIDKFLLYVYKIQYNCMSKSYEYSFKKNSVTLIFFLFHHNCLLLVQFYNKTKKQKPSQNICRVTFFHKWIGLGEGSNVKQVNYYAHMYFLLQDADAQLWSPTEEEACEAHQYFVSSRGSPRKHA